MIYMCTHAAYFTPSEFHPVTIFVTLALVFLVVAVVGFFSFGGVGGGGGGGYLAYTHIFVQDLSVYGSKRKLLLLLLLLMLLCD